MTDFEGYAVFFFEPSLETLGDAIKPYLSTGPAGPYVACHAVDTAGGFVEMTLQGRGPEGQMLELELSVPSNMVRMVVSARSDVEFGFFDRSRPAPAPPPATVPVPVEVPVEPVTAEPVPEPAPVADAKPADITVAPAAPGAEGAGQDAGGEAATEVAASAGKPGT